MPDARIHKTAAEKRGRFFYGDSEFQSVEFMRNNNIDSYPSVAPSLFIPTKGIPNTNIFPLAGISNKITVEYNEMVRGYRTYISDEYGFDNPQGLYKGGHIDIALIGDSFAKGCGVEQEENIAAYLRNFGYKTINLGMGGNGPLLELATLGEYASRLKPKVVLWLYYEGNDLSDLSHERKVPELIKYLNGDFTQDLMKRQPEVDKALGYYINEQFELLKNKREGPEGNAKKMGVLAAIAKLVHLRRKLGLVSFFPPFSDLSLLARILEKADREVSSWGGKLYFVYLPTGERYVDNGSKNTGGFYYKNYVIDVLKKTSIPIIDIHKEVFDKYNDPLSLFPFHAPGHYAPYGYQLTAAKILEHLKENSH